jgi:hypothetical protein
MTPAIDLANHRGLCAVFVSIVGSTHWCSIFRNREATRTRPRCNVIDLVARPIATRPTASTTAESYCLTCPTGKQPRAPAKIDDTANGVNHHTTNLTE